jgi:putative ABC transport system substrate-binding protein
MRRREFITLVAVVATAWPAAARAQQTERIRRVGVLMGSIESDLARRAQFQAFRDGLAKLGWMEDRNLRLEVRWNADPALFAHYASELIALAPDVVLADSTPALEALRQQTRAIPIVFVTVADPIGQGFVTSLAHPEGNITGFSVFDPPMAGKWLGMLKQTSVPVERVAVLFNPVDAPYAPLMIRAVEEAAPAFAVTMQLAPVNTEAEIEETIARLDRGGLLVLSSIFTIGHRKAIIDLAARHRIPAVYSYPFFAVDGGLMSYGVDLADEHRRAADYIDRVLKGAKPSELPVQLPVKFILVINLKTAKALDIGIGPALLGTADEVIE